MIDWELFDFHLQLNPSYCVVRIQPLLILSGCQELQLVSQNLATNNKEKRHTQQQIKS